MSKIKVRDMELVKNDFDLVFDDAVYPINQEAVDEWSAYREEDLKKPLTPRALKMVKKKLSNYPEGEQMRIVEACIENNWRGIHYTQPPKQVQNSTRDRSLQDDLTDTSWSGI